MRKMKNSPVRARVKMKIMRLYTTPKTCHSAGMERYAWFCYSGKVWLKEMSSFRLDIEMIELMCNCFQSLQKIMDSSDH